jgi:hypothetical protein
MRTSRALFDLGDGAHLDRSAARAIRVENALAPEDLRPGRESPDP